MDTTPKIITYGRRALKANSASNLETCSGDVLSIMRHVLLMDSDETSETTTEALVSFCFINYNIKKNNSINLLYRVCSGEIHKSQHAV